MKLKAFESNLSKLSLLADNTSFVNSLLIGRHAEMNLKSRTTNRFIFQIIGCVYHLQNCFRKIRLENKWKGKW